MLQYNNNSMSPPVHHLRLHRRREVVFSQRNNLGRHQCKLGPELFSDWLQVSVDSSQVVVVVAHRAAQV